MGSDCDSYRVLVSRCNDLVASQAKLKAEFEELIDETQQNHPDGNSGTETGIQTTSFEGEGERWGCVKGRFESGKSRNGYVLEAIGHAIHVTKASSGEIVYWVLGPVGSFEGLGLRQNGHLLAREASEGNALMMFAQKNTRGLIMRNLNHAAELLYGWKDYEVIGQTILDFLVDEAFTPSINKIMEKLKAGQSWSGQFPFRKRSGEKFMAIVTNSPMYEDGVLVGVITVSSDAAFFNSLNVEQITYDKHTKDEDRGSTMKGVQWRPPPRVASLPHITSSVSMDAEVPSQRHEEDTSDNAFSHHGGIGGHVSNCEDDSMKKPKAIAAKALSRLNTKETGGNLEKGGLSSRQNGSVSAVVGNGGDASCCTSSSQSTHNKHMHDCHLDVKSPSFAAQRARPSVSRFRIPNGIRKVSSSLELSREPHEFVVDQKIGNMLSGLEITDKDDPDPKNLDIVDPREPSKQHSAAGRSPSSGDSSGSYNGSTSSKGDVESNATLDCEIHWEDIQLGEEIGQGSYSVVYRGLWNGSDVAVKILFANDYNDGTLLGYNKEIRIMRTLRHPNVLLFMGACCSNERLAIVTEHLPRQVDYFFAFGSGSGEAYSKYFTEATSLWILGVARGMNYLHHRNPPIIHRDLKSSNLLVDKNWTVKVGDFGLSKLKHGIVLSAQSGFGTPQWMAPEVLRNEPSNEKSDVFSFGVILWELVTESIPWNDLNPLQVVGVVGFMNRRLDIPEGLDPRVSALINECWETNPELRPSFEDVLQRMTGIVHSLVAAGSARKRSQRAQVPEDDD
ncbi:putative serine/threonine-protein kinase SIS8 [Drosera capensis]